MARNEEEKRDVKATDVSSKHCHDENEDEETENAKKNSSQNNKKKTVDEVAEDDSKKEEKEEVKFNKKPKKRKEEKEVAESKNQKKKKVKEDYEDDSEKEKKTAGAKTNQKTKKSDDVDEEEDENDSKKEKIEESRRKKPATHESAENSSKNQKNSKDAKNRRKKKDNSDEDDEEMDAKVDEKKEKDNAEKKSQKRKPSSEDEHGEADEEGTMNRNCLGGKYCSARGCFNSTKKCPTFSFFHFPRDPIRCNEWIVRSGREDLFEKKHSSFPNSNYQLCSSHFEESEFMNKNKKNKLIHKALPSLFLTTNPPRSTNHTRKPVANQATIAMTGSQLIGIKRLTNQTTVAATTSQLVGRKSLTNLSTVATTSQLVGMKPLMKQTTVATVTTTGSRLIGVKPLLNQTTVATIVTTGLQRTMPAKIIPVIIAKRKTETNDSSSTHESNKIKKLLEISDKPSSSIDIKNDRSRLSDHAKNLLIYRQLRNRRQQRWRLLKKVEAARQNVSSSTVKNRKKQLMDVAQQCLTGPALTFVLMQIKLSGKKCKKWNASERLLALTLYHQSPRLYRFLRCMFSLPAKSSLSRWVHGFDIRSGTKENVLVTLQDKVDHLSRDDPNVID